MADNLISIKTHFEIVQNVKLDKKQLVLWHLVNFITCGLTSLHRVTFLWRLNIFARAIISISSHFISGRDLRQN